MLTDQREEIDCKPKAGLNKSSMRCGEEKSSEYPMIEKEEEMELILEDDALTRDELRTLAGKYDLDKVNYLELSINTADRSVEVLGDYLPNLQQLRLHQSRVQSFRDFGTSLRNLRILWVNRCGITELDGIGSLIGLHELYLAFNDIRDIGPIAMHDELQVLDLDSNRISDIGQLDQIGTCPELHSLTLESNPVATLENYRRLAVHFIPNLKILDDVPISNDDRVDISEQDIDQAVQELQQHEIKDDEYEIVMDGIKYSEAKSPSPILDHSGSKLTHGTDVVFAGNLTSALRRRRSEATSGPAVDTDYESERRESITDTLDQASDFETHSRTEILTALKAWKMEHRVSDLGEIDPIQKRPTTAPRSEPKESIVPRLGLLKDQVIDPPQSARIRMEDLSALSPRMLNGSDTGSEDEDRPNRSKYHFDLDESLQAIEKWSEINLEEKRRSAREMEDAELIEMLMKKPKYVAELKTRDGFRSFFKGMKASRLKSLLVQVHGSKSEKVASRMKLMEGYLD